MTPPTIVETPDAFGLERRRHLHDGRQRDALQEIVKGATDKVIVQSHFGVQCSRCGFTLEGKGMMERMLWYDDIHVLNQAKYLVDAGYSVLMYDFRNHGDSGQGASEWIKWGQDERKDVVAAVDYMSNRPEYQNASIGLLSICMGAASSNFEFGLEEKMSSFPNLKAMVAVQPLTYDNFVNNLGLPKFVLNQGTRYSINKRDIDLTGDSFLPFVKDINVPTLVIQNQNDLMTNLDMVNQFYKERWKRIGYHASIARRFALSTYDWIGKNPDRILGW